MTKGFKQSHKLRKGRVSISNQTYLVTCCTNNRSPLFLDFGLTRRTVQSFGYSDQRGFSTTYAFVVMPDHFHWLLSLGHHSLSNIVGGVKSAVSRASEGQVWQKGFHDRALRTEDDLISVSRYIVANPLRAGLVDSIGDYPHWDAVWLTG